MSQLKPFERVELESLLKKLAKVDHYSKLVHQIQRGHNIDSALLSLGAELENDKEYTTAIRILRSCIDTNPGTIFAYIRLGVCYYKLKDKIKAELCMAQASILFHQHEKLMIASADSSNAAIPLIPLLQAVLDRDYLPVSSALKPSREKAKYMYDLGCRCLNHKYFPGAEICYRLAIEMNPSYSDALANLGTCLCEQNRFSEAVSYLIQSLTIKPNDEITLLGIAFAFLILDYPYFANFCARRAFELKPSYAKAQRVILLSDYSSEIICFREGIKNYWGPCGLSALVLNSEARTNIEEVEASIMGSISGTNLRASAIVRGLAAGIEKEFKSSFFVPVVNELQNMDEILRNKHIRHMPLGAMPSFLSEKFTNLLSLKTQKTRGYLHAIAASIKNLFYLDNEDVQLLADCIGTIAAVRNIAAHGDVVNIRTNDYRVFIRTCLLMLTRARLNRIVGHPATFTWRATADGQIQMTTI